MPPPRPEPPAHAERPRTAELLAPHLLREDVRLSASDRAGTFQLVAADPTGGVIRCVQGDPPRRGELVSFSPLGTPLGPVRLVGRTAGRVRLPGGAPGPFFATEWVAITALESPSYLINVLRLLGVKIHAVDLPDSLGPGQELVYEPAAQHVRLLSAAPGLARQPTVDFDEGLVAHLDASAPAGVLVETHRRRDSSWRKRLRLASSARLPTAQARAGTAPGLGEGTPRTRPHAAEEGRGRRRGPTAPAWAPLGGEERRRSVTEPPVEVRAPRPPGTTEARERKRPTVQETQALFPQGPRWFERRAAAPTPRPAPKPAPRSAETLHPMFRRGQFVGAYRASPDVRRPPRREVVGAPRSGRPVGRADAQATPAGVSPRAPRRGDRTPPPRAAAPGSRRAVGAVPSWSDGPPEFPCDPREGQLEWASSARPVVCVGVGQGSVVLRVSGRVVLLDGVAVRVRLPMAPVAEGGVALEGRVHCAEFDREAGATSVRIVLVPRSVPTVYRRFVQYWAAKRR